MRAGTDTVRVFLAGDVMTGRGVDQILPHPADPRIYESWIQDARAYVALAEQAYGPVPAPVAPDYIWGDALAELEHRAPHARIVNLETSVTLSDDHWPKGINYRMAPANVACLTAARLDVCTLANNHVLDYGRATLLETLATLRGAGLRTAGAGADLDEARRPAVVPFPGGRLAVLALGAASSGIPAEWAATPVRPGVDFLPDLSDSAADEVAARVRGARAGGALVVLSIHWGSNWGYAVEADQVRFAHRMVDAGADVVCGHSSHHPRPLEVYRRRLVLYGCGDLINDYEGIGGHESLRGDLRLLYVATLHARTGELVALEMVPLLARRMRLVRAPAADAAWIAGVLSGMFDTEVATTPEGALRLRSAGPWRPAGNPAASS
ncbi:MAG: CapA family protein [Armatimonadota bacterium]|nr:CapA family protein [Armatimonadota bacterium]MDR7455463.1 CapA family protein [Armatimonadota bacterium]MDR7456001.1 CapA family protein [Armatimonadota bacterium]MDR7495962.1 CapA family protein [Armatimonadota bacterium]MDR7511276.1 CapA family protein [Armatimonadota bacterium]